MRDVLEKLRSEIDQAKKDAAQAWGPFEEARKSFQDAVAKGDVKFDDPDAFVKLDELGKTYDGHRQRVATLTDQWAKAADLAGLSSEEPQNPLEGGKGQGEEDPKGKGGALFVPSIGKKYVESEAYKELTQRGNLSNPDIPLGTMGDLKVLDRVQLKTLITGGATSGGAFVPEDRIPLFVDLPREQPTIIDLVFTSETDLDVVEFVEQSSRTNAAAETAEPVATGDGSGAAPESAAAFAVKTSTVRDITHFIPATKRVLSNAPMLEGLLDAELRDGVRDRLSSQILNGNGTAPNLRGILNTSGILTQALGGDSRSDAIHKAITQVRKEFFEPMVVALHPDDAEQIYLEKDSNGNYIYGPPSSPFRGAIWGLRTVISTHITAGTALVGNFQRGATLWLREGLSVAASDQHSDFFIRRMVALLAVLRAAFAAQRPKAFAQVTGI